MLFLWGKIVYATRGRTNTAHSFPHDGNQDVVISNKLLISKALLFVSPFFSFVIPVWRFRHQPWWVSPNLALSSPAHAIQNMAAVTGDLWPSLRSSLGAPIGTLRRRGVKVRRAGDIREASTAATGVESTKSSQKVAKVSELPDFLSQCSVQDLSSLPAVDLQHGHALLAIPPSVLRDANPYRLTHSSSSRSYSTSLLARLFDRRTHRHVQRPRVSQTRSFTGSFSQNLLSHLERTANNNPRSASAQSAFYNALSKAGMPQIIVERFQTGRYASNQSCEDIYRDAVESVSKSEGSLQGSGESLSSQATKDIVALSAARAMGNNSAKGRVTGGTGDKASPVHVIIDESKKVVFFKYARMILWYAILGYFTLTICTVLIETGGLLKKGAMPNTEAQNQDQKVKFSDVHGCEEAKEELQELVEFLKNPERFSALGGKLPKGVLLVGPPGTGKTLLARAVAGEAGVPFFYMSGSEFDEIYVGVGAKRVRELFGSARAKAPAIVFIDELDAIGAKRNERDPVYVKQSLNQLLTELDGFTQETGVIILGATNFPQLLDKALTRPGRFDRNVEVPLPDVRGRMQILQHYMKKIKADPDVDPTLIARGTIGFSGAQLESLINQAAVRASKNRTTTVTMLDMEWAKDKILMGAEKRSMVIRPEDKLLTAYHEAGHTLVAMHTKGAMPVYKVTVMPRGMSLGLTSRLPEMDKQNQTREELRAHLDVALGGKAAEEIIGGDDSVTTGCSSVRLTHLYLLPPHVPLPPFLSSSFSMSTLH